MDGRVAGDTDTERRPCVDDRSVLIVDDDAAVARAYQRVLRGSGYDVTIATASREAVESVRVQRFSVILSDIRMPELSGIDFLRAIRAHDPDVPVVLMTGYPTLETACAAVGLGALQYLSKPVNHDVLLDAIDRGAKVSRVARMTRAAARMMHASAEAEGLDRLNEGFDRCLDTLWMAFQPIVRRGATKAWGYEALLRSAEPTLPDPGAVLGAAEKLDRVADLGRRVRALTATAFQKAPSDTTLFVNLHPRDLLDPDLYQSGGELAALAPRVVLEITERASIEEIPSIVPNIERLRALGFRIAIDDLGAGYAGLSSFATLVPEFVKLDMSLIRDVHRSHIKRGLVGSIASACAELDMQVLAEGIETQEEADAVRNLGCGLFQGYFFGRPGRPFPSVEMS